MARKSRLCALVVDDNPDVAESFARVLLTMGCDAAAVTDSRGALEEALRLRPHIAFLDLAMPHVDGHQLARELRKHFTAEQLKLVAVSAFNTARDREASRHAGFDAHVAKPVDLEVVEAIVKVVLPNAGSGTP
jgi:CheY-like chemotaxis protein